MLPTKVRVVVADAQSNKKQLILLCYAAMMVLSIGLNLLPVFLTTLSLRFGGIAGLSNEALGIIGAAPCTGLVIGIVITGPLADRFGTKIFAIIGNLLSAVSLVACGLAHSYATLIASSLFLGFGTGMLDSVLSPIVAALEPDKRSTAMNLLHSFYCIGAVVTVLLSTVILARDLDLIHACFILAPFPLIIGLLMASLEFPAHMGDAAVRTNLKKLLRKRWFLLALVAIALGGATELGMVQWLPAFAETVLGYSKSTAGLGLLFFSLAMALGRIIVGLLSHRFSPTSLIFGCCSLSIVFFVIASFSPFSGLAFTSAILAGFAGSALWPTTLAVVADRYPNGGATMYGALAAFGNVGGILMPWLVGLVADQSNLRFGLATSALAPLLMFAVFLKMRDFPEVVDSPTEMNSSHS
jgi:MFS family permease